MFKFCKSVNLMTKVPPLSSHERYGGDVSLPEAGVCVCEGGQSKRRYSMKAKS